MDLPYTANIGVTGSLYVEVSRRMTLVVQRYPQGQCHVVEVAPRMQAVAPSAVGQALVEVGLGRRETWVDMPAKGCGRMLWANIALHHQAQPMRMLQAWHHALAVDGFVMFSCFGPDTAEELRQLYVQMGWPAAGHSFTDMHDWGDMLVQAGFAEPVMDMETIALTFATPERLLQELRELGCDLHPQRLQGCAAKRG